MFKPEKQLFILPIYLCVAVFSGCSKDIHSHPDTTTGKDLFEYHCSGCHKNAGEGSFLKGVPANNHTALSADQISHKIRVGGGHIPSFKKMSAKEADKISAYVKTL